MKNLISFRILLVSVMGIVSAFFLFSACTENHTADSKSVAEQENIAKKAVNNQDIVVIDNDNDENFLMAAAEMHLEEISLGNLAMVKGNSDHVKALGKQMVADHTQSLAGIRVLAQSKSVSIPATVTDDSKDAYQNLNDKSGTDFGKAYSDLMVEHHQDAIDFFEKASTGAEDQEIRNWALNELPGLRTHLQAAEACKKECNRLN